MMQRKSSMKGKLPSVVVIGIGYWGKNLVRNYAQLGALKLICDKNETILEPFKTQYPEVDTCLALNTLFPVRISRASGSKLHEELRKGFKAELYAER